ncbi:MAG: HEAT repeat domain-containing protein [Candidatus Fervidibacter sacchari]
MRYKRLLVVTIAVLLGIGIALWKGLGKYSVVRYSRYPDERQFPEFWQKFHLVNPLESVGKRRAYNQKEMEILRWAIRDKSWAIRVEALAALSCANHDPKQREEAIQLAIESLKDSHWVVRIYALDVLKRLNAKSSIPHILPLLNDPRSEVRKEAKRTLQQLGYKVGE